ncbi:MAG: aminomethyl-transferring glycine dehydrogenase subunit GcvPA [Erysipelotrichaceae bacterium]
MATYIPYSAQEQAQMLLEMGETLASLLSSIPKDLLLEEELDLPNGKSELEVMRELEQLAKRNHVYATIFRGAGAYKHYIPSVVKALANQSAFLTSYTPYQAEMSQGLLQGMFEYQTMITGLTGMDVSNASLYDGACACAEAMLMCEQPQRPVFLMAKSIDPQVQEVMALYAYGRGIELRVVPSEKGVVDKSALEALMSDQVSGVLVQSPNYYGLFENVRDIAKVVHAHGATMVLNANPLSFGISASAKEMEVDLCVGEAQPLGLALGMGGPYLGYMCSSQALLRRLPGRIVGQTCDLQGRIAYTLTLQAREQHIRREKALSSICSNQAHCALTSAVYMATMGPLGIQEVARACWQNAHYLAQELCKLPGFSLKYEAPFFHEFVTLSTLAATKLETVLKEHDILAGLPLGEHEMLWCATEYNTVEEVDALIRILKEVC